MKSNFSNENKVIILLVSLFDSYGQLVTILLYDTTTHVLKDVINSLMKYYYQKKYVGETCGKGLFVKGQREHER
ncbi:unnamed protein product [Spirodela intermedia]|uniref:Uncharacterized protein n=1 Tax=Spirodela intermedia TaxID=51605 RepID=A0A7I8K8X7_SPIIN|nr:unnamed protein product [Spirodela intermedia]